MTFVESELKVVASEKLKAEVAEELKIEDKSIGEIIDEKKSAGRRRGSGGDKDSVVPPSEQV